MQAQLKCSVVLGFASLLAAACQAEPESPPPPAPPKIPLAPKIRVSRETTYFLKPLNQEGLPDYVRALNDEAGSGVTAENNTVVPLLSVLGTGFKNQADHLRLEALLHTTSLPQKSNPSLSVDFIAEATGVSAATLETQLGNAAERPWTRQEFPELDAWLNRADSFLSRCREAAGLRPRFYLPLLELVDPETESIQTERASILTGCRQIVRLLCVRALRDAKLGKTSEMAADLDAAFRIASLIGQSPNTIDYLSAIGCHAIAARTIAVLAGSEYCPESAARALLEKVKKFPPVPSALNILKQERAQVLENLLLLSRKSRTEGATLGDQAGVLTREALARVDFNIALREANAWYDRTERVFRETDVVARSEAMQTLVQEVKEASSPDRLGPIVTNTTAKTFPEDLGRVIPMLFIRTLLPPLKVVLDLENTWRLRHELVLTILQLQLHRTAQGPLPDSLSDAGISLPIDPYTKEPVVFRKTPSGFVIYGVGPNRTDDGGPSDAPDSKVDDVGYRVETR